MKNLLTQWKTEKKNLGINLMKNLLTQWKTEEKNQKTGGDVPLINRKLAELEDNAECAFLPKLTELENDAEYASFPKFIELVKKPSNLTRTRKVKLETLDAFNFLGSGVMLKKSYQ